MLSTRLGLLQTIITDWLPYNKKISNLQNGILKKVQSALKKILKTKIKYLSKGEKQENREASVPSESNERSNKTIPSNMQPFKRNATDFIFKNFTKIEKTKNISLNKQVQTTHSLFHEDLYERMNDALDLDVMFTSNKDSNFRKSLRSDKTSKTNRKLFFSCQVIVLYLMKTAF